MTNYEKLEKLAALKKSGAITKQEFEQQKSRLLADFPCCGGASIMSDMSTGNFKMIPMGQAYANFWKKYFDFTGTAQRSEYWWALLVNSLIWIALFMMLTVTKAVLLTDMYLYMSMYWMIGFMGFGIILFCLSLVIPTVTLLARRCHDVGISALWLFLFFLPIANVFLILVLWFAPSDSVLPNRFRIKQ